MTNLLNDLAQGRVAETHREGAQRRRAATAHPVTKRRWRFSLPSLLPPRRPRRTAEPLRTPTVRESSTP